MFKNNQIIIRRKENNDIDIDNNNKIKNKPLIKLLYQLELFHD